jgi:hypothetical protein
MLVLADYPSNDVECLLSPQGLWVPRIPSLTQLDNYVELDGQVSRAAGSVGQRLLKVLYSRVSILRLFSE